jgi:ribonuclease D
MRDAVEKKATEFGLEPAVLASKKQLEAVVRSQLDATEIPERMAGWRRDVITESLLDLVTDGL